MSIENMPVAEKDYATMSLVELEQDPAVREILDQKALEYLTTIDKEWFNKNYTGEMTGDGYLMARDGTAYTKPMQNIGGGKAMDWVMSETKKELLTGASADEIERIAMPRLFVRFEKLYAEAKDKAPGEFLDQFQELAREAQDPQLKEYLAKTAHTLLEAGKERDFNAVAQSIIDAFMERGKDFGMRA